MPNLATWGPQTQRLYRAHGENQSSVLFSKTDGANGLKLSLNFIFKLS